MDKIPGVLLYKIISFGDVEFLPVLEVFSTTISAKLASNSLSCSRLLRKHNIGANLVNFVDCKDRIKAHRARITYFMLYHYHLIKVTFIGFSKFE